MRVRGLPGGSAVETDEPQPRPVISTLASRVWWGAVPCSQSAENPVSARFSRTGGTPNSPASRAQTAGSPPPARENSGFALNSFNQGHRGDLISGGMGGRAVGSVSLAESQRDCESQRRAPHRKPASRSARPTRAKRVFKSRPVLDQGKMSRSP